MSFDATWYPTLPREVRDNVCLCPSSNLQDWTQDKYSGWYYCKKCHKPSYYSAVHWCSGCRNVFIPPFNDRGNHKASCPKCSSEYQVFVPPGFTKMVVNLTLEDF